jgi:hypothetical protein
LKFAKRARDRFNPRDMTAHLQQKKNDRVTHSRTRFAAKQRALWLNKKV